VKPVINLAGNKDCDRIIRDELEKARIEILEGPRSTHEVAASLTGTLHGWYFRRAWYYWVAHATVQSAAVPIEVARSLYADPIGRTDIRSGGHCACPSPDEYGATYYDADGHILSSDPLGTQAVEYQRMVERGVLDADSMEKHRFVVDKKLSAVRVMVDLYHIDSLAGLRLFADTLHRLAEAK
jgi:hypothetical protein